MTIHTVRPGDTLFSVARQYGVPLELLAGWNGLAPPYALAVGQALLVLQPTQTYQVAQGDTLFSVARRFSLAPMTLLRRNPQLEGSAALQAGQLLTLSLQGQGQRPCVLSGYAYPYVRRPVLQGILPYATYLVPFTYGIGTDALVAPEDGELLRLARQYGAKPLLHLSTLTEDGSFSTSRAAQVLAEPQRQQALAEATAAAMADSGYEGVDVDFEFVGAENAAAYAEFVGLLRRQVNALGYPLITALAPKVSVQQPGVLYEGHDYAALAQNSDAVLLMTYEWGYTYGPPLAVAPLPSVRRVLDYAVTEMPRSKILMGFPNYGYDWTLPFVAGSSMARSIGCQEAVELAVRYGAEIRYDETAQSPYFYYTDSSQNVHEVWFEDPRSCLAKFRLVTEYGFRGIGVWNFMRPFRACFSLLDWMFDLVKSE